MSESIPEALIKLEKDPSEFGGIKLRRDRRLSMSLLKELSFC